MTPLWKNCTVLFISLVCCAVVVVLAGKPQNNIETVNDPKEWKKLLRTRTNVLVAYSNGALTGEYANVVGTVSRDLRGTATLVFIDCTGAGKKLCKKNKASPEGSTPLLRHYKDGDFHKDYDRRITVASMTTFLRDPVGDLPWDEDSSGNDVMHIGDMQALNKLLKSKSSFLMMFYAPWCGFCKRLKPDYSAAATEIKPEGLVMAAMDVNKPENSPARFKYNITGFPTLVYFEAGKVKLQYEGENTQAGLVSFMRNPQATQPAAKPAEESWADTPSEVHHLTTENFHTFIKAESSVLVMFYAPWCGHCKNMKPEYIAAASELLTKGISGKLAAVDATKQNSLATEFGVKGFPTLKYFANGEFQFEVPRVRDREKLVDFMKDPKEPPPPPAPEAPWSSTESEVLHLNQENFKNTLKKKKHVLVMFYAPWCGHCKKAKPEITKAAATFKDDPKVEFAAVDCTTEQGVCSAYDVKAYPTIIYFNYYKKSFPYSGGRTEKDFVKFMSDPKEKVEEEKVDPAEEWKDLPGSNHLLHLTSENFSKTLKKSKRMLVMFYAPWCGHCKAMKADFALAAKDLADEGYAAGYLATVDSTVERSLSSQHGVKGFPTLLYFVDGVKNSDYDKRRTRADLVAFMKEKSHGKDEL